MKRLLLYALLVLVFGAAGSIAPLLIFWANEQVPVAYSTRSALTPQVAPGGELRIKIKAEISKPSCKATVFRSIVDSADIIYDIVSVNRPAFADYEVVMTIPLGAAPGKARYRARVEWNCNPVQKYFPLVILQPELEFEILPVQGLYITPEQVEQLSKAQKLLENPVPPTPGTAPLNRQVSPQ